MYIIQINFSCKGSEQHQFQLHMTPTELTNSHNHVKEIKKIINMYIYILIFQF